MNAWVAVGIALLLLSLLAGVAWLAVRGGSGSSANGGTTGNPASGFVDGQGTGGGVFNSIFGDGQQTADADGIIKRAIDLVGVEFGPGWQRNKFVRKRGSDGRYYYIHSLEPDRAGFVEVLVSMHAMCRKLIAEIKKRIKDDNTITSLDDDESISRTEYNRLAAMFAYKDVSPIGGFVDEIAKGFAGMTPVGGGCVFLSSQQFHKEQWTWQLLGYVMHELAHAATGGPPQQTAHTAEFFRLFHALGAAGVRAGVWRNDWISLDWQTEKQGYSTWGWDPKNWSKLKMALRNYHWNGNKLVAGQGQVTPGSGSLVKARKVRSTVTKRRTVKRGVKRPASLARRAKKAPAKRRRRS